MLVPLVLGGTLLLFMAGGKKKTPKGDALLGPVSVDGEELPLDEQNPQAVTVEGEDGAPVVVVPEQMPEVPQQPVLPAPSGGAAVPVTPGAPLTGGSTQAPTLDQKATPPPVVGPVDLPVDDEDDEDDDEEDDVEEVLPVDEPETEPVPVMPAPALVAPPMVKPAPVVVPPETNAGTKELDKGAGPVAPEALEPEPVEPPAAPVVEPNVPVKPEATLPTKAPADTAALVQALLSDEALPDWKRKSAALSKWQEGRGLKPDGLFGPKTALTIAGEIGTVPIVRYWPRGSFREGPDLKQYKRDLRALAMKAPEPRASQLVVSADREQGQGYGRSQTPIKNLIKLGVS